MKDKPKRAQRVPETGFFWHVHHDTLFEWCYSHSSRVRHIHAKPSYEVKRRLKLFKPIRPLPTELRKLLAAALSNKSNRDFHWNEIYEWLSLNDDVMEALHRKQCPRCPWNGSSIF